MEHDQDAQDWFFVAVVQFLVVLYLGLFVRFVGSIFFVAAVVVVDVTVVVVVWVPSFGLVRIQFCWVVLL